MTSCQMSDESDEVELKSEGLSSGIVIRFHGLYPVCANQNPDRLLLPFVKIILIRSLETIQVIYYISSIS